MEYREHTLPGARIELATYNSTQGASEFHLIIHATNLNSTFQEQLDAVLNAYITNKEGLSNTTTLFKRFYVSDAANQTEAIIERLERINSPLKNRVEGKQNTLHDYTKQSTRTDSQSDTIPNNRQANKHKGLESAYSIVQQPPLDGTKIALWVYLMSDIKLNKKSTGLYQLVRGNYSHLWYGGAFCHAENSEEQMRKIFEQYIVELSNCNCTLANNCLRTWIYVQNVDTNYQGVVKARNEIFSHQKLTKQTHYIASTGIDGTYANPKVLVLFDAYAVAGITHEQIRYLYAPTHLNPTHEYGVSFERGTSISYGDRKQLFISGTASINNQGEIEHVGNIRKQTERMWENVEMLLKEANADFNDMGYFLVYLRDSADYHLVKEMFDRRFPSIPTLITWAPVCRSGWLIEMECMGSKREFNTQFPPL